ncbi:MULTISPECIES: PTS sugar transporter subunit IIA [unclassified Endozoicomonas]|uniref:PTS sugar transporter subunit IIA n=1 Tax=unclassified Endozoicomonas TaxID=2644528 RepID=UPI0021498DF5|nr:MULTISPECIES: PTS sugar transporter subunit IIA [unclassified Endozoicomonas]
MLKLEKTQIFLQQEAKNKHEALQLAGSKMLETGLVSADYLPGIHARETLASTFLDNGIAIPHGMPQSRHAIKKTGVVVIQFPEGVEWGVNQPVFLAFGVAAHCHEHLRILGGLTRVLDDRLLCRYLARTHEPEKIIDALEGKPLPGLGSLSEWQKAYLNQSRRETSERGWVSRTCTRSRELTREYLINNINGLHARCGSAMIAALTHYDTRVYVRNVSKNGEYVNGRSLVKLLGLELVCGETLGIRLSGLHAHEALKRLDQLISEEFTLI